MLVCTVKGVLVHLLWNLYFVISLVVIIHAHAIEISVYELHCLSWNKLSFINFYRKESEWNEFPFGTLCHSIQYPLHNFYSIKFYTENMLDYFIIYLFWFLTFKELRLLLYTYATYKWQNFWFTCVNLTRFYLRRYYSWKTVTGENLFDALIIWNYCIYTSIRYSSSFWYVS